MHIVFNSLFPVFVLMILGAVSRKFDILGKNSENVISKFVLYFSLPAILFITISKSSINELFNVNFTLSITLVTFGFYICIFLLYKTYKKSVHVSSIRSLGISFPNTAFMGFPILLTLFGEKALLPLAVVNLLVTLIFCITVLILELTDKKHNEKNVYKKVFKIIFTQPILLSILIGMVVSALNIKIYRPIENFCNQLGPTAGPCAMFVIGEKILDFKLKSVYKRPISFGIFAKLVLMPLTAVALLLLFNVSPLWAACGLILMAMPSAGTTYMLAIDKGICVTESSELIILTTVISLLTLAVVIFFIPYIWPTVQFIV